MSGTKEGGLKASKTVRSIHGDDFYSRIGKKGGSVGRTGGFFGDSKRAAEAGRKGGKMSRRSGPTDPALVKSILLAKSSGASSADVAKRYDITESSVNYYYDKYRGRE